PINCSLAMANAHLTIGEAIASATKGRPYVFLLMPFGSRTWVFDMLRRIVRTVTGHACIRADDIKTAGFDLLEKIHAAIERADLVVAEISDPNANVFYELGYTVGSKKPALLLAQRQVDIPADMRGIELIQYDDTRGGIVKFKKTLSEHLQLR